MTSSIVLTGDDKWFDPDKSEKWQGVGANVIWRTHKGSWIEQTNNTYVVRSTEEAARWLLSNGHREIAEQYFKDDVAEDEV